MKTYRDLIICTLFFLTITAFQAFPEAFEEREPRDEKSILVPKGARPVLKEEYPRTQLVADRIRARHSQTLVIPFSRSWNTAAITALSGIDEETQPDNNFELGFALHSQRLRVGSLRNKEYFERETEGFPESWYWPFASMEDPINRPKGYATTTFVHLSAKRMRNKYTDYKDFADRINGTLNVSLSKNKQLTFKSQRDMQSFEAVGVGYQPRVGNTAGVYYNQTGEGTSKLEIEGNSKWSSITDSAQRDLGYIAGYASAVWVRTLHPDLDLETKAKLQISTLRDRTLKEVDVLETRKTGWLDAIGTLSLAGPLKLKLKAAGLYDSEYEGYFTPGIELALMPKVFQAGVGIRRRALLPDHDEIYWPSKSVKINDDLQPEDFWEAYGTMDLNVITRLILHAEAAYSRPGSRITWQQLSGYVWEPVNAETSEAVTGTASLTFNIVGSLNTFASFRYQYFDNRLFDPEITTTGGISYGGIALGASFWDFQPLENTEPKEDFTFAYIRISKNIRRVVSLFIDGRYTFNGEDVLYYRGMPQAGRIVSVGANIVFGGLD